MPPYRRVFDVRPPRARKLAKYRDHPHSRTVEDPFSTPFTSRRVHQRGGIYPGKTSFVDNCRYSAFLPIPQRPMAPTRALEN